MDLSVNFQFLVGTYGYPHDMALMLLEMNRSIVKLRPKDEMFEPDRQVHFQADLSPNPNPNPPSGDFFNVPLDEKGRRPRSVVEADLASEVEKSKALLAGKKPSSSDGTGKRTPPLQDLS